MTISLTTIPVLSVVVVVVSPVQERVENAGKPTRHVDKIMKFVGNSSKETVRIYGVPISINSFTKFQKMLKLNFRKLKSRTHHVARTV